MNYIKGVQIYTDGACRGNPGPGGWGAILIHGNRVREISGGERITTNNRMELTAVIRALQELKKPSEIDLYSDSNYIVMGMTSWLHNWKKSGWKRKTGRLENIDLWQQLDELAQKHLIRWHWVRGHFGNPYNERADKLAREAVPKGST